MADSPVTASPNLPCPRTPSTQQDFLDLFDRILPSTYLDPMKSGVGPGYELFQAFGSVGERVSLAISRTACQSFVGSATGGSFATVTVQLFRQDTITRVTVLRGTVLLCSASGRRFTTNADVHFEPSQTGPFDVTATSIEQEYEYNVTGQRTAANGPTIQVRQIPDATGGSPAALDQLGADRGITRLVGEDDQQYRVRIKQLPDTVSPGAIRRACQRAFRPWNHGFAFVETWDPELQLAYDIPNGGVDGNPAVGAYDDPVNYPLQNLMCDAAFFRGAFVIVVDNLEPIYDVGFAYDDPGETAADYVSPNTNGMHAIPAYDLPDDSPDDAIYGCFDGIDQDRNAVYAGLADVIDLIKPAGVSYTFLMPEPGKTLFPLSP